MRAGLKVEGVPAIRAAHLGAAPAGFNSYPAEAAHLGAAPAGFNSYPAERPREWARAGSPSRAA